MKRNCPRNPITGNPDCNIVQHPDWPNQHFCSTCGNRFYDENHVPILPIALMAIVLGILVTGLQETDQPGEADPVPAKVTVSRIAQP
ncbi:MAG: hypothetical protein ACO37W_10510 [Prochlorotrichaceae cyanobacterium]